MDVGSTGLRRGDRALNARVSARSRQRGSAGSPLAVEHVNSRRMCRADARYSGKNVVVDHLASAAKLPIMDLDLREDLEAGPPILEERRDRVRIRSLNGQRDTGWRAIVEPAQGAVED